MGARARRPLRAAAAAPAAGGRLVRPRRPRTLTTASGARPVVVVGAGPTGLTAALLLAAHGVPSLVLDRRPEPYDEPRAVHLDDEVVRVLHRAGVGPGFAAVSRPALGLRLVDRELRVLAQFDRGREPGVHGHPAANLFDQPALERLLRDRVGDEPLVDVQQGADVVALRAPATGPARLEVERDGRREVLLADHVLGCDGAHSTVRRAVGVGMVDLRFRQRWLVVDVETDADLGQWEGVHQVSDPHRAATFLRIGEHRYRWEFRLLDGEDAAAYAAVPDLLPLLRPWTGDLPPQRLRLVRVAEYVFRAQVARRWRRGPVLLLGDAAHLTPPFIGQGLGAGLRDAHNVAWKLAGVVRGELDDAVLDSYQAERRPHVLALIGLATALGVAMTGGGGAGQALRRGVLPRAQRVPGLRRRVLDSTTPRLRGGLLPRRPRGLVGTLAPNAPLPDGRRLDDLPQGWLLVTRRAPRADGPGAVLLVADDDPLGAWLAHARVAAALVRPDATVAAAGDDPDAVRRPPGGPAVTAAG